MNNLNKCMFSNKITCKGGRAGWLYYCRGCVNLPNFQKARVGEYSLEFALTIAISGARSRNVKDIEVYGLDDYKCPAWVEDIFKDCHCHIPGADHVRIFRIDKDFVVTSEPYGMTGTEIKELVEFCEKHDLTFRIDGVSSHVIGHTFRVYIYKKDENKALEKLTANYGM